MTYSRLPKPPNILEYLIEQSIDGATTINSNLLKHLLDTGASTRIKKVRKLLQMKQPDQELLASLSAIVEYLRQNRETILQDRSVLWLSSFPDTELLRMLGQGSTSRGRDFYPFWNSSRTDFYNRLSLPLKTDSLDSDLNSFNGFLKNTMLNSWYSTQMTSHPNKNLPKMSSQSCKFLTVESTDEEDINLIRCKKIKLKIPYSAKKELDHFSNLYRFCYNASIINHEEFKTSNKFELRNFIKSDAQQAYHPWIRDLPTELREGAAFDVATALKAGFSNMRSGNIKGFKLSFKSKKVKSWTLNGFQKRSFQYLSQKKFMLLPTYLPFIFESYEKLPTEMECDFKLHFDGNDYYLLVPQHIKRTDLSNRFVTSLDPGVRTFQTIYHDNGDWMKACNGKDVAKLYSLALQVDRLISCKKKGGYRTKDSKPQKKCPSKRKFRKHAQHLIQSLRERMKNLQKEMHSKVANYLTITSKVIICPEFRVKEMSKKFKRKINCKTVRNMSLLAHATFRETLKTKAAERSCQVILASEHYTSKTCGNCGNLKEIRQSKIYNCKECGVILDRDVNGARNVMLRAMRGSAVSCNEMNRVSLYGDILRDYHCRLHQGEIITEGNDVKDCQ